MKLVIVAMPESVHTARWILQLLDQGWKIYLFPSTLYSEPHPMLRKHIDWGYTWRRFFGGSLKRGKIHLCRPFGFGIRIPFRNLSMWRLVARLICRFMPYSQYRHLRLVVWWFQPDLVHSLEFQMAGELCLRSKQYMRRFPRWIATNWGSDVLLYHRLTWSKELVHEILQACEVYSCECERDVELARKLGFRGHVWPVLPNTGGLNLKEIQSIRAQHAGQPRRRIMLKGYHGWSGRALFAIRALREVGPLLKGYTVTLFSWNIDSRISLEITAQDVGFDFEIIPHGTSHAEILHLHAQARAYIGAGISDGLSTSCIEAMAMGAFPIQSESACCREWFRDGESGIKMDGEDIGAMACALKRVLSDDAFYERAREINYQIIDENWGWDHIKTQIVEAYKESLG
ncbi:MAG: glycosyltransferase family 4 protein [Bdellovibrionales bacterium]